MRIHVDVFEQRPGDVEFDSMHSIKYMLEEIGMSVRQADVDGWNHLTPAQQNLFWEALRAAHDLASAAASTPPGIASAAY